MKRTGKYISVCLCAVMIASMFMCGGCQKQEKTKITKKKQIELWHYWDIPGNQQHLEELVDQFNQSQDKIEVKVSYIPDEDFKNSWHCPCRKKKCRILRWWILRIFNFSIR